MRSLPVPSASLVAVTLGTLGALVTGAAPALAQFSIDPAASLQLSDGAGDEVQVKLAPSPDGSTYVSFFDSDPSGSPAFGYDVKLQRIAPNGVELWAHGGVLIADRGYSSTQDYGLSASPIDGSGGDGGDDAFLAFRDDRFTGDQVTATRVLSDGSQPWGPTGVQLTSTTDFIASPKVAATPDGGCVVAWTQASTTRLQKLDASGVPQWAGDVLIPVAVGETASLADLGANPDGSVVVSWVAQSGGFFGPRNLRAQRLSSAGAPLWGATGVDVFVTGSLQIGNFPSLVPDGGGGALFTWYGTGPLQCYAQHVLATGIQAFGAPGTGVEVSLDAAQIRVNPSLAYRQATGETFVFWIEQNSVQSMDGVSGQKFDASGARQWGPNGIAYVPLGSDDLTVLRAVQSGDGAVAGWLGGPGFGQDVVRALRVDAAGALQHPIATIATTPSSKSRIAACAGPLGDAFFAWQGDELGDVDVLAQNLLPSGAIGPAAGGISRTAGANVESYSADVDALGGTLHLQMDVASTGHAFGGVAAFSAPATIPYGADVILVNALGPELLHLPLGAGPVPSWSLPIPASPTFLGLVVYTQGVHVDPTLPLRFTNAIDVYLGLD